MNACAQDFWRYIFIHLGFILKHRIAGGHGTFMIKCTHSDSVHDVSYPPRSSLMLLADKAQRAATFFFVDHCHVTNA